jgi:flavin reductase (DIM6/NTAB) family NADH-FMN oxidoreductase RutF
MPASPEGGRDPLRKATIDDAISKKYPEGVAMIVSIDERGRPNAMPAGWYMFTSGDPPMIAISISPRRFTHELIERTRQFVVAFPSEDQSQVVDACGSCTGSEVEKFDCFSIVTEPSLEVKPPLIAGSVACLECELESSLTTGDHTIFVGRILAGHVSEGPTRRLYNLGGEGIDRFRPVEPA